MSGAMAVGYFLFSTAFSFILFILWARVALTFFKISPFFALSQSIFRLTNPVLLPIHMVLSRFLKKKNRYDIVCLSAIFILEIIKYALMGILFMHTTFPFLLLMVLSLISMIVDPCNFLFYAIIGRVILSWVNSSTQNAFIEFIYTITEPVLYPIRKRLPFMGGLDFSPLIAIIALRMITVFLTTSFPLAT